jgi:hypothetical protein
MSVDDVTKMDDDVTCLERRRALGSTRSFTPGKGDASNDGRRCIVSSSSLRRPFFEDCRKRRERKISGKNEVDLNSSRFLLGAPLLYWLSNCLFVSLLIIFSCLYLSLFSFWLTGLMNCTRSECVGSVNRSAFVGSSIRTRTRRHSSILEPTSAAKLLKKRKMTSARIDSKRMMTSS